MIVTRSAPAPLSVRLLVIVSAFVPAAPRALGVLALADDDRVAGAAPRRPRPAPM